MGIERRRHKRVDCNLPIRLYVQGNPKPIEAEIRNISISGAFVQAQEAIPTGEKVLIEFRESEIDMIHGRVSSEGSEDEEKDESISANAAMVWIQRVQGTAIGVEFVSMRPQVKTFLSELIDALDAKSPQ